MWWLTLVPKLKTMFAFGVFVALIGFGVTMYMREGYINTLEEEASANIIYVVELEEAIVANNLKIQGLSAENAIYLLRRDDSEKRILVINGAKKSILLDILKEKTGLTCEENMSYLIKKAEQGLW